MKESMRIYPMTINVACKDDADFRSTQLRQKNKRIFTSSMLNGITDISETDPNTLSAIITAATRKDMGAIMQIGMKKMGIKNPFGR